MLLNAQQKDAVECYQLNYFAAVHVSLQQLLHTV